MKKNQFKKILKAGDRQYFYYDIGMIGEDKVKKLPFSLRILLENLARKWDDHLITFKDLEELATGKDRTGDLYEIPFFPSRVLMQDFTGVPAVVDLAAMRDAVAAKGADPSLINPLVPVDLVVDHSVQIDSYGRPDSLKLNVEKEYERNHERYALLKWAQKAFNNFRVVPPNSGICHQVNLEYLGKVVMESPDEPGLLQPDSLVGTDSHTTMINGLGIMGWGVGGIEAEAVMLGQPYYMPIPDVVAMRLTGKLKPGTTATDLVLTVTEKLRKYGVVEKFVEFTGPGVKSLSLPDRAVIANMAPEYGATMGFFPVDEKTMDFLRLTGREKEAEIAELYARANHLWYDGKESPDFRVVLELDLGEVVPSLAGPNRPQDRLPISGTKSALAKVQVDGKAAAGMEIQVQGQKFELKDGMVAIASITSCTNTANPGLMIGAALVAQKAVAKGLKVPVWVKTSLAPGSRAVQDYLEEAGLMASFDKLGFNLAAFGCVTCIGNSGPLDPAIEKAQTEQNLALAAVLSGNRNFEGRVHPHVKAAFLASPLLVVAYALAGRVDLNLETEPLGMAGNGEPVFLRDIWPTQEEIERLSLEFVKKESFIRRYKTVFEGDSYWKNLQAPTGNTYQWDPESTYIQCPPYFEDFSLEPAGNPVVEKARCLLSLGDSITTDHISPAGNIRKDYPAGQFLISKGQGPELFNSYGARRGNHEVMMRGTFANIRIKNRMTSPKEGAFTLKLPEGRETFVYDAAMDYKKEGTPLIILGGKEYGTGSSRDWAAKGTVLLGVRAVITQSFERIHRSNLVGMGVLPLCFLDGQNAETLGLKGREVYRIHGLDTLTPGALLTVEAEDSEGKTRSFQVKCRLNTDIELEYFRHQGILPYVLRKLITGKK